MAGVDRRRVMTDAEFDAIPAVYQCPIENYYDALILLNARVGHDEAFYGRDENLTTGQRLLIHLWRFNRQILNGGVTQFFWNCGEFAFDVADWFEALGLPELRANYDRALEALAGNKDQWLALRAEWGRGGGRRMLEAFQQSFGLLDLNWFDDDYFDGYKHNEKHERVITPGMQDSLRAGLVGYVRAHRAEFITG